MALGRVVWIEFGRKFVKVEDVSLILEKTIPCFLSPKISVSDSKDKNGFREKPPTYQQKTTKNKNKKPKTKRNPQSTPPPQKKPADDKYLHKVIEFHKSVTYYCKHICLEL